MFNKLWMLDNIKFHKEEDGSTGSALEGTSVEATDSQPDNDKVVAETEEYLTELDKVLAEGDDYGEPSQGEDVNKTFEFNQKMMSKLDSATYKLDQATQQNQILAQQNEELMSVVKGLKQPQQDSYDYGSYEGGQQPVVPEIQNKLAQYEMRFKQMEQDRINQQIDNTIRGVKDRAVRTSPLFEIPFVESALSMNVMNEMSKTGDPNYIPNEQAIFKSALEASDVSFARMLTPENLKKLPKTKERLRELTKTERKINTPAEPTMKQSVSPPPKGQPTNPLHKEVDDPRERAQQRILQSMGLK
jgi:hypothetical protein